MAEIEATIRGRGVYKPTGGYFSPDRYAAIAIGENGKIGNAETHPETSGRR